MAKTSSTTKKQNKIDLQNLSERDRDFLFLDVKDSMKKYKIEKQGVYDRRFALNKKLREAGITAEQVLGGKVVPKKAKAKREEATADSINVSRELMVVPEKSIPVIMKPIEINFENFSIKLNGVPKKISVNPDTHAIEIDL
ncbi:hypothetical protein [Segetibacter sp.]|jgi:hypothetical protein|uniref:hypothetical protein n=1 Tax=Segetibacter sp. TaxID=2231182 RepID=UPI00262204B9|nr:hypothetical protein [Segetibacter sp.]MCW3082358.1 hypothetical protein [Segetibacter sp.]